ELEKRHGMNFDVVADHKLHPGKANAIRRNAPPTERRRWIGKVEHHLRARARGRGQIDLGDFHLSNAFVDEALTAFGARDSDLVAFLQHLRGQTCADNSWQSEL